MAGITHTLISNSGELRHGHTYAGAPDPDKVQWHEAGTYHRTDPKAHDRSRSWTHPNWSVSSGRHWELTEDERKELLADAHARHDNSAVYGSRDTWAPMKPSLPKNAPTPTPTAPPTAPNTSSLEKRVDEVEGLVLLIDDKIGKTQDRVDAIHGRANEANLRVAGVRDDLNLLLPRVEQLEKAAERKVHITVTNNGQTHTLAGMQHERFGLLLDAVRMLPPDERNVWIAGPAGSGKTTAARQLATALSIPFDFNGAIDTEYKLSGFIDAQGRLVSTAFRRIYEKGGVYLFDECDASMTGALIAFNAALANGWAAFPDGSIERHPDCIVLAAGNTWGLGGDANYVGRAKLDAAFLDRFVTISWDYDEALERELATHDAWTTCVQAVRKAVFANGAQIVVSPRASIKGGYLLNNGMAPAQVVEVVFGRYRKHSMWPKVGEAAERFARQQAQATTPSNGTVAKAINASAKVHDQAAALSVDFSRAVVFGLDKRSGR